MLRVSESMTAKLLTAHPLERLHSAYERMQRLHIRHLPVVNDEGHLEGILSDRDLLKETVPGSLRKDEFLPQPEFPADAIVRECMTSELFFIDESDSISTAIDRMLDLKISSLIVKDGETAVGLLTTDDLLRVFKEHLRDHGAASTWERITYLSPLRDVIDFLARVGI